MIVLKGLKGRDGTEGVNVMPGNDWDLIGCIIGPDAVDWHKLNLN